MAGLRTALATAFLCTLAGVAAANPTGMQVVAGQVTTVTSGNQLLITNSPGSILNWQSFSIMPGELTRFIQQSASSTVLNRITGQSPSQILGALQSNGRVFLINPNGIVFGAGSRVDVNGLVASSLNLSDADFLAGNLKFSSSRTTGNVSNSGGITTPTGGQVYLIAPNVTNTGIITSPGGDVMLAAGHSVDLADSNDPDVRVVVSAPGNQALNVGEIVAQSGRVGVYGALVNQLGLVSANSAVAGENGKIVFKSTDTTLLGAGSETTATGAGTGGEIEVLGNRVGLTGNAVVDANGQTGGGTVLVGGDTHGSNAAIPNATLTYVGPQAQIDADAIQSGSGGKVVVWSDEQTQMYGGISARGGALNGDGGAVETSSANKLDYTGEVDLRAPHGSAGTLLLDPSDIVISSNDSTSDISVSGTAPFTFTASNTSSNLSTSDLQNQLGLGNVTVTTSSSASAPLGGTITVSAPVAWTNSNSLTLAATQDININAPITAASGTLVLSAANGSIAQALNSTNPATITVAALSASAPNGSVSLTEPTNAISGAIAGVSSTGFSLVNSGALTVGTVGSVSGITTSDAAGALGYAVDLQTATVGDIVVGAPINATGGTVVLNSAGGVTQGSGGLINANMLYVFANGAGGIGSSSAPLLTNIGTLGNVESQGAVYISNSGDLVVNYIDATGAVGVTSGGSLSTATAQSCDCTLSINGSSIALTSAGSMTVSSGYSITGTDAVALNAGFSGGAYAASNNTLTVNGSVSGTTVALSAGGAITVGGTLTGTVTQSPNLYTAPPPPPPTLDQCIANPALQGCSAVLPTLAQCISAPGTPGCTVVLPTLAQCTATPSLAGCTAVLPTLAQCISTPTQAGCAIVLPSLSACVSTPTQAGCSAVLPTLSACIATPAQAGCSVVLPSLSACIASPTQAGCAAVLPSLSACVASPAQVGCALVLPSLNQCMSAPALAGCTAVLPSLSACVSTPTQAGCTTVLPTLSSCLSTPTQAGCTAVLPTLSSCLSTPTLAGCSAVLPTVTQCTTNPTLAGCTVVLPPVTQVAASEPITQAVNQTVALINTTTIPTTNLSLDGGGLTSGTSSTTANWASNKAAGNNTTSTSTNPGTSNDTAKKMYCN